MISFYDFKGGRYDYGVGGRFGDGDDDNGEGGVQKLDGIAGARCHQDGGQMASAALDPKSKWTSCCYAHCNILNTFDSDQCTTDCKMHKILRTAHCAV